MRPFPALERRSNVRVASEQASEDALELLGQTV